MRCLRQLNGHDIPSLISTMEIASCFTTESPVLVHVPTEKGHGLPCAATHAYRMHFSMPFDPITGAGASPTIPGQTYATVAASELAAIMTIDDAVTVLTPGTPYASGLEVLKDLFPTRVIDCGMAEAHTVSMAAGLAMGGRKPVICIQGTFLQRAWDQVLHDVCSLDLPVTFLVVRSGFAGYDSETHHSLWDIPVLRSFPNMQLHYAMDTQDLRETLTQRLAHPEGPLALLTPYEPVQEPEPCIDVRYDGAGMVGISRHGTLLCLGNTLGLAHSIQERLHHGAGKDFGIAVLGRLKPFTGFDRLRRIDMPNVKPLRFVTVEEGMLAGGFGSLVAETFLDGTMPIELMRVGVPDCFVPAGAKEECAVWARMTTQQIAGDIMRRWWPEWVHK